MKVLDKLFVLGSGVYNAVQSKLTGVLTIASTAEYTITKQPQDQDSRAVLEGILGALGATLVLIIKAILWELYLRETWENFLVKWRLKKQAKRAARLLKNQY